MNWDGSNRRKFPRVVYPCLIKIASQSHEKQNILTHTENIGIGGVSVTVKKEVKLFTDVELEIDLLDVDEHIKAIGKVVWSVRRKEAEEKKPLFYDLGIEFVNLHAKQKERLKQTLDIVVKNGATILKPTY